MQIRCMFMEMYVSYDWKKTVTKHFFVYLNGCFQKKSARCGNNRPCFPYCLLTDTQKPVFCYSDTD